MLAVLKKKNQKTENKKIKTQTWSKKSKKTE